ncbi:unnamed protein product [Pedinophyceae sp. YPF-701]|nr:unnamed protein product [Pedinophyceae sp. YPF-701]
MGRKSCEARAARDPEKLARMMEAVKVVLSGVGELDLARPGILDTPKRVAKAFLDMTECAQQEPKDVIGEALFQEPAVAGGSNGMVLVRSIDFSAMCRHTLMPFVGRAHVAYLPSAQGVVVGLSKVARIVRSLSKRPQTQADLARGIVEALDAIGARGTAVLLSARHLSQGADAGRSQRLELRTSGAFRESSALRLEFLALLRLHGVQCAAQVDASGPQHSAVAAVAARRDGKAAGHGGSAADLANSECSDLSDAAPASAGSLYRATAQRPLSGEATEVTEEMDTDSASAGTASASGACAPAPPWDVADAHGHLAPRCPGVTRAAMEGAVAVLLREAGLWPAGDGDGSGWGEGEAGAACRRHVSLLLAGTRGYETEVPRACGGGTALGCGAADMGWPRAAGGQSARREVFEPAVAFQSLCEHHMLPFYGTVRVGYASRPGAPALPWAELRGLVDALSRRLQVQERLGEQLADAVAAAADAEGVMVAIDSAHMCMVCRGVERTGSSTVTVASRGVYLEDSALRLSAMASLFDR